MKELRFGVHVVASSAGDEWASVARKAEERGFSVLTLPDHLLDGCLSPFAALGVAAEATSILRFGTLVLNNDLRHPALVAREVLALDWLSGGRMELGVGAGSAMSSGEHESIGVPFDDGQQRVARLAEAVEVLDGLLRGDEVTFHGEHYHLIGDRAWPPPTQHPRPPILVGGHGRQLLQLAAERADVVGLSGKQARPLACDAVDQRIALIRNASAGRDLELQALVQRVLVTDRPRDAAAALREHVPELSVEDVLETPHLWIGSITSICDKVRATRERWGLSYFTVFDHDLDAVTQIVTRLTGT